MEDEMTLCGEDRDIAAMNNELNHLYQRIHASPAVTADLPENLGTGRIIRAVSPCGTVVSSWKMKFGAEGNATWGFGAVCGASWGAAEITDCKASGTSLKVSGERNRLVGGLLGFAGSYDPESPAQISGCLVEDVEITVSDTTDCVGGLVGAGKEMMEGSDTMSSFEIKACTVSGTITGGGNFVDPVVGDSACAVSVACEGGMTLQ